MHLGAIVLALCLYGSLSRLCGVPEPVIHDAQLCYFLNDPFGCWVRTRLTLASFGIFDEPLSIPNDPADIHLVVQDAVATLGVAIDSTEAPIAAAGCRDAIPI
ncbi:hypothetical protein V1280_008601 [Bradyrhizobium sp. AZCC 2230]